MNTRSVRPAVAVRKIAGYGFEKSRYEVLFLDEKIGEVFSFADTVVKSSGGRRYGDHIQRTMWEVEDGQSMLYTRRDAIISLLESAKYPGRRSAAERLVRNAGL